MELRILFAAFLLPLAGCSSHRSTAEGQLLAHTWAPSADTCGTDFLRFTPVALEVHHPGSAVSALQVVKLTTAEGFPNNVMVVAGPNPPGTPGDVPKEALVAFVLEITDGRMKLVGGGVHVTPISPRGEHTPVRASAKYLKRLVELRGIEPLTSAVRLQRSPI